MVVFDLHTRSPQASFRRGPPEKFDTIWRPRKVSKEISFTRAQITYWDILRVIASQMVLLGHSAIYFLPTSSLVHLKLQNLGVVVFFLLSGLLISHSVFRNSMRSEYSFKYYFIDRFFRIFSCYLPAIILVSIIDHFLVGDPRYEFRDDYNLRTAIGNALMLQDFPLFQLLRRLHVPEQSWFIRPFASAQPFWTLSVEWWLYMLFGGIFFTIRSQKWTIGIVFALALVSIEPAYHFVGGTGQCLTEVWLLGVMAGLTFAEFSAPHWSFLSFSTLKSWKSGGIIFIVGILLSCGRVLYAGYNPYDLQFIIAFSLVLYSPAIILARALNGLQKYLSFVPAIFASYSYSLYLVHNTILTAVVVIGPEWASGVPHLVIFIIGTNLSAAIFSHAFERHYRYLSRMTKLAFFGADGQGARASSVSDKA
jgi:peptidoglycan/LPS O-acetylase OafA/YrhL